MAKYNDNNIVLLETEKIKFPNSQISEDSTGNLVFSGSTNISADKVGGITVDNSAIADGAVLSYDQASGKLKYVPGSGSFGAQIESIQLGTVLVPNNSGSASTTITVVDTSNSFLIPNGFRTGNDLAGGEIRIELTDSTTVTAYRVGSYATDCYVNFSLLEFVDGSIAGVQRGTITMSNPELTDTATINAVDTSKCVLSFLGNAGNGTANDLRSNITLTNSTTITAQRNQAPGTTTVGFEILEFN